MSYSLNTASAKSADALGSSIRESGKYIGTITRAEALLSTSGTKGIGLSFKADDGASADYLDLYTHSSDGKELPSLKAVNALLACLKLRQINEGPITFEKWDKNSKQRVKTNGKGYPDLMGKRVGLLLRKFLDVNTNTGDDREGVEIFGIFQADTELTASEVLDQKTQPERLSKMVEALMARPVNDKRKRAAPASHPQSTTTRQPSTGTGFDDMDDDIPF